MLIVHQTANALIRFPTETKDNQEIKNEILGELSQSETFVSLSLQTRDCFLTHENDPSTGTNIDVNDSSISAIVLSVSGQSITTVRIT